MQSLGPGHEESDMTRHTHISSFPQLLSLSTVSTFPPLRSLSLFFFFFKSKSQQLLHQCIIFKRLPLGILGSEVTEDLETPVRLPWVGSKDTGHEGELSVGSALGLP